MIYTDLAGRYFDWLYERVCGDWEPRGLSFHRLLTFLYNQNFTPSCELDGARAEDGLDLRYRFAQTQNVVYQDVQDAFAGIPCSMLEMMVALSIRIEEHILEDAASGNRVGQWFWNMVVSLGLVAMDDTRFNEERAQSVLDRFNAREYQPNGAGGLFTLMHPKEDGRHRKGHRLCPRNLHRDIPAHQRRADTLHRRRAGCDDQKTHHHG